MRLKAAFMDNPRLQPLLDGSIQPEGIEFAWEFGHPAALNLRHLTENPFDVFEFSLSGYLVVKDRPEWEHLGWTSIPIFLSKAFLPLELCINTHSGIASWADLAGKRLGLPDYNMTASIWMRIMLKHLYSIQPGDITWINGRRPKQRHSTKIGFRDTPLHGERLLELVEGESLNELLQRGEIDAAFGDRQVAAITEGPNVRRLLNQEQARQLITDFAQKTGTTPSNHTIVVQERLLAQHPNLATILYKVFEAAKQESYRRALQAAEAYLLFPESDFHRQADIFGEDPYLSGIAANHTMIDMLIEQLVFEGQIQHRGTLESLFAEPTYL
jgi:4,5-dihydroxyphthalate decarboxylase